MDPGDAAAPGYTREIVRVDWDELDFRVCDPGDYGNRQKVLLSDPLGSTKAVNEAFVPAREHFARVAGALGSQPAWTRTWPDEEGGTTGVQSLSPQKANQRQITSKRTRRFPNERRS